MWGINESQKGSEENNKSTKNQKITFESLGLKNKAENFFQNDYLSSLSQIDEEFLENKKNEFIKSNDNLREDFISLEDNEKDTKLKEIIEKKFQKNFIEKENLINWLEKTLVNAFVLSDQNKLDLKTLIKKESIENLKKISLFKSMQERFLLDSKIYKNAQDIKYREDTTDKLAEVLWNIANEILKSSDLDEEKIKILEFINSFSSLNLIDESHIENVFSYLIDKWLKKEAALLLNHFISKISLKNIRKYWLKSKEELENIKEKIIKEYKQINPNLKIEIGDLDEDKIFIDDFWDIKDLKNTDFAYLIVKEINKLKEDTIKQNYENSILRYLKTEWDNENINNSFIDYIKNNPLKWVNNIWNLKKGSYLIFETKKSDWKIHRMIQKVDEVDSWVSLESKAVKLSNYTSSYWVLKTSNNTKDFLYENFYEFLKLPSLSNENEESKIDFLTEEEYRHYKLWETKINWKYEKTWEKIQEIEKEDSLNNSKEDLKAKIDAIDPAWAHLDITKPWSTTFVVWNPWDKDFWYYSIISIDDKSIPWKITLSSKDYKTWINETLNFNDFLRAFELKWAKRWEFIWEKEKFAQKFLSMKAFDSKFELKDWKLLEKVEKGEKARKLEYLANSKWEAIKIEEFWLDYVSICTWNLKEETSKDWKTPKRKFSLSYPTRVSYEDFYAYINNIKDEEKDWYKPILEEKEQKPDEIKDVNRKSSIWKSLLSFYCINDIMTWLKMLPTLVEDYLKQWSSIRSAKFALALWKNLPDSVRLQLQSKVESEWKKAVEDLVGKWVTLDSTEFVPIIKKVILNKSSEDFEVEAAMISILKKYWVLYRWQLAEYKWTFVWYKALGGKPNDALYMHTKKAYEAAWKPFTEEALLEELLKIQSLPVYVDWKLNKKRADFGIMKKRRSKFGKDYGWYVKTWIDDELKDWRAKTEWMLSVDSVIWYSLWEFSKLAYNNWLGAMDVVWEKWWDIKQMNMIPHIITSTWIAQSLWDSSLNSLFAKSFKKPYPALHFCKTNEDIQTYRNVCRKLVEKMNISSDDKKSFYDSIDDSKNEAKKVEAATKFYGKHWNELMKKLMINQDPVIFLEKDSDPDFKKYYEKLKSLYTSNDYGIEKWWIENWFYNYDTSLPFFTWWTSFMFKAYSINTEKWSPANLDTKLLNIELEKWFKGIASLNLNIDDKKKIFEYYFKTTEWLIHWALWGQKNIDAAKTWKYPFLDNFKKATCLELFYESTEKWYQDTKEFKKLMEKQWLLYKSKFIDNSYWEIDLSQFGKEKQVKSEIENEVFDILKWDKKVNDFSRSEEDLTKWEYNSQSKQKKWNKQKK